MAQSAAKPEDKPPSSVKECGEHISEVAGDTRKIEAVKELLSLGVITKEEARYALGIDRD